jgi:CheY-like chemotaxis protein
VLLLASEAARNRDLPPSARADFDAIRKNVEMEARLIDDLLDLTRVTHGKLLLEKRQLEVHDVLREAIATVQNEIEGKKITLKLALNAKRHAVSADAVRLQQVFWNILRNAVKFTPENGTITVETSLQGPRLKIKITDTGIGILEDDLKHIFQAFSQGKRSSYGGLGLGLTISKKLVEMHAGSIHATSEGKNRGTAFCIELPLVTIQRKSVRGTARSSQTLPPPPAGDKPARRSRVLLVEDHEPTRAALTRLLLHRRFEVTGAGSVAEARSCIDNSENNFDLLISDIGLPDGNGYDLMNHVRKDVKGIALTGYGMEEDVQRSHAAGFATHLTKPVKIELLDEALASVFQGV